MDPDQLELVRSIGDELAACVANLDVASHYNSVSLTELRERFVSDPAGTRLDDVGLEYRSPDGEALTQLRRLSDRARTVGHPIAAYMLASMIEDNARFASAIMSHDSAAITESSLATYGAVPSAALRRAEEILASDRHHESDTSEATVGADEAAASMRAELSRLGLDNWRVEVRADMHARMSVSSAHRRVSVRSGAVFSPAAVERLIVHEIGTHVVRAVNGAQNPLSFLRLGLPGYQATEEGLAVHHEMRAGLLADRDLRRYALRVMAVQRSLTSGFDAVVRELMEHTTPLDAFEIAMRVKRGFSSPGLPGADVKDQVYLRGMMDVGEHLERYPDDWKMLLVGKIGLQHLEGTRMLMAEGLVVVPGLLPNLDLSKR